LHRVESVYERVKISSQFIKSKHEIFPQGGLKEFILKVTVKLNTQVVIRFAGLIGG
jgi:hypothetical protein